MSDQTTPTTQPDAAAPAGAAQTTPDPTAEFRARVADLEAKLAERTTLVSTLTGERDALAEKTKLIESLTTERDKAVGEVTRLINQSRETALLDKLYSSLPHAPRTDVARTVKAMAAEGKVNLHTDTPDRTAADVLGMLKTEQSALLRTPVGANGATNPPVRVAPKAPQFLI
jgi:flagellar motility protein MotE (MotC chaperone)